MRKHYWIGIDTGGTFTDLVLRDIQNGSWKLHKVPTWTEDPAKGILAGIVELLALASGEPADIDYVVLGTTKATNAVLEGKWARTGMLTTAGFCDVLDIARQRRPHYFNLDIPKPKPPALHADRRGVPGRMSFDGKELTPLDEEAVIAAIAELRSTGLDAVAICFMHAYANPAHEEKALALVREHWPEAYVCTSSEVMPEFREYERFITTTVNASLMPVMDAYLEKFEAGVRNIGVEKPALVMQSNGGAVSAATVRKLPINTFFSGPAGGVMAAVEIGRQTNIGNLIAFDMGGTSTDISLIKGGRPSIKHERSMGGLPVRTPSLDIHTIGAGGGSLAWIDEGGMLKVGPRSAGAYPGPAAYGRDGDQPTVTDANVVLGRLNPVSLLGGRMPVFPEKAVAAFKETVCKSIDYDVVQACVGTLEIANVHMTGAVRVISVEKGEDPGDYALVAFGGAGPLHAVEVARASGIRHVIIPPRPGLLSAQGLLQAAQRGDFGMTCLVAADASNVGRLQHAFGDLQRRVDRWFAAESGSASATPLQEWTLELRYAGQSSDLPIAVDGPIDDAAQIEKLRSDFHSRHLELFGYEMPQRPIEIAQVRVSVTLAQKRVDFPPMSGSSGFDGAIEGRRQVWFSQTGYIETPIVKRELLAAGTIFAGPAIVEQMDTTTVITPDAEVRVDEYGYLHVVIKAIASKGEAS